MAVTDDDPTSIWPEATRVRIRRFREARTAGMTVLEAKLFAESEIDIGELRRLVKLECPVEQITRILL